MSSSITDALKKAFAEKGLELPRKAVGISQERIELRQETLVSRGKVKSHQKMEARLNRINKPGGNSPSLRNGTTVGHQPQRPNTNKKPDPSLPTVAAHISAQASQAQPIKQMQEPFEIKISEGVRPACQIQDNSDNYAYVAPAKIGTHHQAHAGNWHDEREVVIGLDFGTSSVKVIIGDRVLKKAFAVPFSDAQGVRRYLLPTRLYETDSYFSLEEADQLFRDLKLSLLANPSDAQAQLLATAFLALVIRHARGWLLSELRDVYHQTNILWKLVVGVPAAHHLQDGNQNFFYKVAQAAWLVAASSHQKIRRTHVSEALLKSSQMLDGAAHVQPIEEVDISVVPEIAAQIYGYVASNRFDRGARNLYLMVDVGAGTVDSSLFQVKLGRGGRFGFSFYTSQVQPNGVMNLHRHRMNWWETALGGLPLNLIPELSGLKENKFATDRLHSIPENYADYFSDIQVQYRNGFDDPDQHFFKKQVVAQVRGQSMWRTWKDNLLTQQDLNGIPMFLCGGGTRMQFYRNIEHEMKNMPGCSWLNAESKPLEPPKSLVAPGLPAQEYDRLSVAFGLSFLEVSEVVKATPIPQIIPDQVVTWRNNYVDKDQC